jgi:Queuine tRNA-ribosyltransferases, contain PUA domain
MTKFFEIDDRDGPARIGKLYIHSQGENSLPFAVTPFLMDSAKIAANCPDYPVRNIGTYWKFGKDEEKNDAAVLEEIEKTEDGTLLILPRNQFTLTYPEKDNEKRQGKLYERINSKEMIGKRPTAAVIRPIKYSKPVEDDTCGDCEKIETAQELFSVEKQGADVYIMESAGTFEDNSIGFFEAFSNVKERLPADTALWLPNLATPENAAMLIYLGADILDTTRAEVAAASEKYMTAAGTFFFEDLTELPCRCSACAGKTAKGLREMPAKERRALLLEHNINALEAEISLVREKIRAGALREYVEGQCRTRTWLTGLLRLFDSSPLAEKTAPTFRRDTIYATTAESQNRAEIRRFAQRIMDTYEPPKKEILLIFPCSSKKPYSISMSHQKFIQSIERNRKYVNELIITSPMGIIPRELELTYPAAHYDTTVTGHWDLEERAWVGGLLEKYLEKNKAQYKHIVAHVEGPYREICEAVSEKLGLSMIYTVERSPTAQASLKNLRLAVDKIVEDATPVKESETHRPKPALMKRGGTEEKADQAKAIARYQIGPLADELFTEKLIIKGNFPKFMLLDDKTQLAVLVPQFGQLAFSIAAVEKLIQSEKYVGQYTVKIDNFLPKGSLLAPGIIEADPAIRSGDEVIILGENVIGIGKAKMSGIEMNSSTKGVAVLPRHTKWINE